MENRKCYMETRKNYIMVSSAKRFDNMLIVEVKIMKKKKTPRRNVLQNTDVLLLNSMAHKEESYDH